MRIPGAFRRRLSFSLCLVAVVLVATTAALGQAQNLSPDLLKSLRDNAGVEDSTTRPPTPRVDTYKPTPIPNTTLPRSRLEDIYTRRVGEQLDQFGYDALGRPTEVAIAQSGAVPDSYILGPDDEVVVNLRGQENSTYRVRVGRDGTVVIPKLSPVLASGRSLGSFRADIETQVAQAYVSTKVFVTLGEIHQISVLVSGEVNAPGTRVVSSLASPLDAILLAGGIKKSGSLRAIRVTSGTTTRIVDLYSVVARGTSASLGVLRNGDRVYVPTIGRTVAISGSARRPGIYELPAGAVGIQVKALFDLAGGPDLSGSFVLSKLVVQRDGSLVLQPAVATSMLRDGEVLFVSSSTGGLIEGAVTLRGATVGNGRRSLASAHTVGELFRSSPVLGGSAYTPFAIVRRRDPVTNAVIIVPVSIAAAIRNIRDVSLQSNDVIYVLTRREILALTNLATNKVNMPFVAQPPAQNNNGNASPVPNGTPPQQPQQQPDLNNPQANPDAALNNSDNPNADTDDNPSATVPMVPGPNTSPSQPTMGAPPNNDIRLNSSSRGTETDALGRAQAILNRAGRENLQGTPTTIADSDEFIVSNLVKTTQLSEDALLRTAHDNIVWILDQVREPGPYLSAPGTPLADMIQVAGGPLQVADLSQIEVTSTAIDQLSGVARTTRVAYAGNDPALAARSIETNDVIRLRQTYSDRDEGTVTVAGEVRYPGAFDITRDERLSSLLQRAGGITEVGYPYGAVFTRREAALAERDSNERSARELENQIPLLLAKQNSGADVGPITTYLSKLVKSVRDLPTLGRVVITADPTVLAVRPELDLILEPGDTLYVPKRPSTVTVSGEVLHAGNFQHRAELRYTDYIGLAGGVTQLADDDRSFIVFPDGTARPIETDWVSFDAGRNIPPGAMIVVPRNLRPFDWAQFLKDATQIVSQLAVTAASLSVIGQHN